MSVLPTPAKIALITVAGVAVLSLRYVVAHAFTILVLAAVVGGIVALVSSTKAKHKAAEQGVDHVVHALGQQSTRYGLPYAQPQQQSAAWSIADAMRHHN